VSRVPPTHAPLLGLLAIVPIAGCGYHLIDYSEPVANLGSVSIHTFENDSYEPGVELVVADALRREFLQRGGIALVDDAIDADLVVSGVVEPIITRARSYSTIALALEWEIVLRLTVDAQWSDGSRTRIDQDATRATERYLASADIEVTRQNRAEAIRTLASKLSAHVHDILYELHQP
jgi:outer membrane lipopolysaccharide assembly protein LptE/RlpB